VAITATTTRQERSIRKIKGAEWVNLCVVEEGLAAADELLVVVIADDEDAVPLEVACVRIVLGIDLVEVGGGGVTADDDIDETDWSVLDRDPDVGEAVEVIMTVARLVIAAVVVTILSVEAAVVLGTGVCVVVIALTIVALALVTLAEVAVTFGSALVATSKLDPDITTCPCTSVVAASVEVGTDVGLAALAVSITFVTLAVAAGATIAACPPCPITIGLLTAGPSPPSP